MNILSPLNVVANIGEHLVKNAAEAGKVLSGAQSSYASLTSSFIVSPKFIFDKSLTTYPHTSALQKAMVSIFAAYYGQSFVALTAKAIVGCKVVETFDSLNPSKKINLKNLPKMDLQSSWNGTTGFASQSLDKSSYEFSLPRVDRLAVKSNSADPFLDLQSDKNEDGGSVKVETATITQDSSMGVGKVVDFTVKTANGTVTFPIAFRPAVGYVDSFLFKSFAKYAGRNLSFSERVFEYRIGAISAKELIFLTDVSAERRKIMMNDNSGYFKGLLKQKEGNAVKTLISGGAHYGTDTAAFMMSSDTARLMEQGMAGSLEDPNVRKRFFEKALALFFIVVDTEIDVVRIYYRDIATVSEVNVSDFVNVAKTKSNEDLSKVLQALLAGRAPTF